MPPFGSAPEANGPGAIVQIQTTEVDTEQLKRDTHALLVALESCTQETSLFRDLNRIIVTFAVTPRFILKSISRRS